MGRPDRAARASSTALARLPLVRRRLRHRPLGLGLVLVLSSCHATPLAPAPTPITAVEPVPSPQPGAPPEPFEWQHELVPSTAGERALVPSGTSLWISPTSREPVATAGRSGAVEVLGRTDGFLEVALDWRPAPSVAQCWPPLYPLALRVFVREDELEDVVTHAKVIDLGDGTGFNIAPGAAARPSDEGLWLSAATIDRDQGVVRALVPNGSGLELGKIYTPAHDPMMHDVSLEPGTVRVGDDEYDYWPPTPVFAYAEDDPHHVLYGVECLQIAGFHTPQPDRGTSSGAVDPTDPRSPYEDPAVDLAGAIGKGGPHGEFEDLYEIPAGAALSWPDGAPSGTSVRALLIQRTPIRRGSRRCFTLALETLGLGGERPTLEFCVGAKVAKLVG